MSSGAKSVEALEAEAAAWAARLDAAPDQPHPELETWLAEDSKHAGALLRAQATLAMFDRPSEEAEAPRPVRRWQRGAIFGGGAAALAASVAAIFLIGTPAESYETQVGEVRSLALGDGSSVAIDAKSRIAVRFGGAQRDIELETGKVLFRAAHDAGRPFRVIADNVVITDIGTAFQVTRDDALRQVEVLVTEGAVRVDAPSGRIELVAGQRARFAQTGTRRLQLQPDRVATAEIERTLAWRNGKLELNGETLDSAIAEYNRHSRVQLSVANPALGRESLYGAFRMDDAAGFARTVALGLGTEVQTGPDGIVIGPKKK